MPLNHAIWKQNDHNLLASQQFSFCQVDYLIGLNYKLSFDVLITITYSYLINMSILQTIHYSHTWTTYPDLNLKFCCCFWPFTRTSPKPCFLPNNISSKLNVEHSYVKTFYEDDKIEEERQHQWLCFLEQETLLTLLQPT